MTRHIKSFIDEHSGGEFDPNTKIEAYRSGIQGYIVQADEKFSKQTSSPVKFDCETIHIETSKANTTAYVYRADGNAEQSLKPCIVYFTGSGFVYSSAQWQARNCIDLAIGTGAIVVNIEESVAPEHKFPKGVNEAFAVVCWLFKKGGDLGIDPTNISLCGFSSGGNFAAVIARWCLRDKLPLAAHYLISPWLDLTCKHSSYQEFSSGYLLDQPVCDWLRQQYTTHSDDYLNPDVSPLLYKDSLLGLSPCTLIVGGCEPFRDECEAYARLLNRQGVAVRYTCIPDQIHEFGGCNRWRLARSSDEDPIAQVILSVCADRAERIGASISNPSLAQPSLFAPQINGSTGSMVQEEKGAELKRPGRLRK